MIEKRQAPRFDVDGLAWVMLDGRWISVDLINVSERGVGLSIRGDIWRRLADLERLETKIRVDSHVCRLMGQVMWSSVAGPNVLVGAEATEFLESDLQPIVHRCMAHESNGPEFDL